MRTYLLLFIASIIVLCLACSEKASTNRYFPATYTGSQYIEAKNYEVFLPASYASESNKSYPVLYMMDRQNQFVDSLSYSKTAWQTDDIIDSLAKAGIIQEVIVVAVDHASEKRFLEYMPQKALDYLDDSLRNFYEQGLESHLFADDYLKFLTQELKARIDSQYRTLPDAQHTYMGGSSMGGLISMYAVCEYPEVFGGGMCLSTHWPIARDNTTPKLGQALVTYFEEHVPDGKKWYFDYGTEGLDQYYEGYQLQVDTVLMKKGYQREQDWMTRKFPGDDHSETSWQSRLHIPLTFMLAS